MKFQAREIVRAAKRNRIVLTRGTRTGDGTYMCVDGLLQKVLPDYNKQYRDNQDIFDALEAGFEGWTLGMFDSPTFKRYYRVGENINKMVKPQHYYRDIVKVR